MSADLMTGIQTRWAATTALIALLPAASVKTGTTATATVPYATINKTGSDTVMRANSGDAVDEITVAIMVSDDDYDDAHAIMDQVKTAFDRADFALTGNDKVIGMFKADESEERDGDTIWRVTVEFRCQVYLAVGV